MSSQPLSTGAGMSHKLLDDIGEQLRLAIFGGFSLFDAAGEEISISLRKGQGLLAYLALAEGQRASREHIAGLFWGEAAQQNARQSLRQVLFSLTRDLVKQPLSPLVIDSQYVALRPGAVSVDVLRFRELAGMADAQSQDAALRTFGGELLKGFDVSAEAFEIWLSAERQQIADMARMTVRAVVAYRREQGQLYQAISACQSGLRIDPLDENLHRTLMELYVESEMHSSALAQYRYCQGLFRSELGVELQEETQRLYKRILKREESGKSEGPSRSGEASRPEDSSASFQFLERGEILDHICQPEASETGAYRNMVVEGEFGLGKSELLRQVAVRFAKRSGWHVLRMRGHQQERDLSLAPWMEVIGELEGEHGESEALQALRETLKATIESSQFSRQIEHRTARVLTRMLAELGQRKAIILIVDDADSLDHASLRLIDYCLNRAEALNLRVVLSWNAENQGRYGTWTRHLDCQDIEAIRLPELSRGAIGRIIAQMLSHLEDHSTYAIRQEIEAIAEGNPMVARQLAWTFLKSRKEGVKHALSMPTQVTKNLWTKMANINASARRIFDALAVAGEPVDEVQLSSVVGLRRESVLRGLQDLAMANLIREVANQSEYQPRREYERQALLEGIPLFRRREIHRAFAEVLSQTRARNESQCVRIAKHHESAGDNVEACRTMLAAAAFARNSGAYAAAAQHLRNAERLLDERATDGDCSGLRVEILLEQARLAELGQHDTSLHSFLTTASDKGTEPFPANLFHRLLMAQARHAAANGEVTAAHGLFRQAAVLCRTQGRALRPRAGDRLLGRLHLIACSHDVHARRMAGLVTELQSNGQRRSECEVSGALGLLLALRGCFDAAQERFDAAFALAERIGDELLLAAVLQWSGMAGIWHGQSRSAEANLLRAEGIASAHGDQLRLQMVKTWRSTALIGCGEHADARVSLEEARHLARDLDDDEGAALSASVAAHLAVSEGDPVSGRLDAEAVVDNPASERFPWIAAVTRRALARAILDDPSRLPVEAERVARHAVAELEALGSQVEAARSLVVQARAHRAAGNVDRAAMVYRKAADRLSRMDLKREASEAQTLAAALDVGVTRGKERAV